MEEQILAYREDDVEARRRAQGKQPESDHAELTLKETVDYQYFAWFERHLQRLKYSSARGVIRTVAAGQEGLEAALENSASEGLEKGLLALDASFEYPRYYTAIDFHQHPGGVWTDNLAGFAYEYGRQTTTPLHVDPDDIHLRMAPATPRGDFRRILDWGCGTGKSTFPFAPLHPGAELHGIDLSAPCLKLAYLRSVERGIAVRWAQPNMEQTEFPDGHFDLVHSTFMLHEMPPPAIREAVKEAFRILAPGGWFVNLDFHSPPGGVFGDFIHYGHGRRNNEFFMRSFCEMDFLGFERSVGFETAEMRCFDDGTGLYDRATVPPAWRFPWQLFVARKAEQ